MKAWEKALAVALGAVAVLASGWEAESELAMASGWAEVWGAAAVLALALAWVSDAAWA